MLATMLAMIREHNLAALATQGPQGPRASLMTYLYGGEGRVLYLITSVKSRKFANLKAEPRVSLLIDDRLSTGGRVDFTRALTVQGEARVVEEAGEQERLKRGFATNLPHLSELALDPDCRVLRVKVLSLLLLQGPDKATYMELA